MNSIEFPDQLLNPVTHQEYPVETRNNDFRGVAKQQVITYPDLFTSEFGGEFHPFHDMQFLEPKDMYQLQALFAASQFLIARVIEYEVFQIEDINPFIVGRRGTIHGLYSELSMFSSNMRMLRYFMSFGPIKTNAYRAYNATRSDIKAYAPFLIIVEFDKDIVSRIEESMNKLLKLQEIIDDYLIRKQHFEDTQLLHMEKQSLQGDEGGRSRERPF